LKREREREEPGQRRVTKRIKERRTRGEGRQRQTRRRRGRRRSKKESHSPRRKCAPALPPSPFSYVYNRIYATLDFFILSFERRDDGFRERERKRACVSSLSLFDARNRGEMIQTESPSFFIACACLYDMCCKNAETRVAPKKKMEKKQHAHQITCETLSFLSLSLNCVALFF